MVFWQKTEIRKDSKSHKNYNQLEQNFCIIELEKCFLSVSLIDKTPCLFEMQFYSKNVYDFGKI